MNATTTNTDTANTSPPPASGFIQLDRVEQVDGQLLVSFSLDEHSWQLPCKASDLQTFTRFQAKVADSLGLWIDHHSQDDPRSHYKTQEWRSAVGWAFDEGAEK